MRLEGESCIYYEQSKSKRFYSKLVRLEGDIGNELSLNYFLKFLFQIGAIRRSTNRIHMHQFLVFLFQIGAIRSAKVAATQAVSFLFLFQIGAIRSDAESYLATISSPLFLFQIGAIRSDRGDEPSGDPREVSIPNWCD